MHASNERFVLKPKIIIRWSSSYNSIEISGSEFIDENACTHIENAITDLVGELKNTILRTQYVNANKFKIVGSINFKFVVKITVSIM